MLLNQIFNTRENCRRTRTCNSMQQPYKIIDRTSAAREFNIGGIRFQRCSGIMIHPRRICPQQSAVAQTKIRGIFFTRPRRRVNLVGRGNFLCARPTENIFQSLSKSRKIRIPRYTTPTRHKVCLSSPFLIEDLLLKSNKRTMAAYFGIIR